MAPTRQPHSLDIYQDPDSFQFHPTDIESELLQAFVAENSSQPNLALAPSTTAHSAASPRKFERPVTSQAGPLGARSLNSVCIPPPMQSNYTIDSPQKSPLFYHTSNHPMQHMSSEQLYGAYSHQPVMDKENIYHMQSMTPQQYPQNIYGYKAPLKRAFPSDALLPPSQKLPSSGKKAKTEETSSAFILPDPSEMPAVEDDGTKPPISYANLIGMAILRAPNRRLTLAQIYKWISDHYSFYRSADGGWQNSIRHNLSLNKNFIKQERPKDDPGKGNYWIIKPGEERTFIAKDRPLRPVKGGESTTFVQQTQHDFIGSQKTASTPAVGSFSLAPSSAKRFDTKTVDSSKFPDDNLSSDGTLPASDPALNDEDQHDSLAMPPPAARNIRSSPPAEDINSSPPPLVADRSGTPPGVKRPGSRKLNFNSNANDSGYYSSIESSVTRAPGYANMMPTSEADRPRHKRGRAEEELARIRSSSYDSPSKDAGHRRNVSVKFDISSPKRPGTSNGFAPATPGSLIFKRPALPLVSASPGTSLANHRLHMQRLLESPGKNNMTPLREGMSMWSPHFNSIVEQDLFMSPEKTAQPTPWRDSIFNTAAFELDFHNTDDLADRGSPGKRRLSRAVMTSGALADITGSTQAKNNGSSLAHGHMDGLFNLASPPFQLTPDSVIPKSSVPVMSPYKRNSTANVLGIDNCSEWLDLNVDQFWGFPSPSRNNSISMGHMSDLGNMATTGAPSFNMTVTSDGSEEGVDILQEFGKIGANLAAANRFAPSQGSPVKRPGLGRPQIQRSVTSKF
ncbi:hypothetical protein K461DRAFT_264999 [Myriangium duriaei CBS 260.36]|uniref:Fork-head domain-containing protein n=1 Tax=Myriangium duriaei CBS 260.36 TaxID=1168546 RepID=A0A9P4JCR5_9PEZI|nr:hypothetical protein K461DRAFT_264999 [Myriangium duriaei CBS 260.36]